MPKLKDVLTEQESLEVSRLRILMLNSTSLFEAKKYREQIINILNNARDRYYNQKKHEIV